jgi:hypothetical protein
MMNPILVFAYVLVGALTIRLCDWLDRRYRSRYEAGFDTLIFWPITLATIVISAVSGRLDRNVPQ